VSRGKRGACRGQEKEQDYEKAAKKTTTNGGRTERDFYQDQSRKIKWLGAAET